MADEPKGLNKPVKLKADLAAFLGATELPRTEITKKLWEYIKKRTDEMLQQGLLDEVRILMALGALGTERPLRSIGYKESFEFLLQNGELKTEKELSERISISTRQLAKSQRTFFKKIPRQISLDMRFDQEKAWQKTLSMLRENKNPLQ